MLNSVKIKQTGKNILRPRQIQRQYSYLSKGGFQHCGDNPSGRRVYKCIRAHARLSKTGHAGMQPEQGESEKEGYTLSEVIRNS